MPEVFRDNFWGQKCSAIGKRLGTTGLGHEHVRQIKILSSLYEKKLNFYILLSQKFVCQLLDTG